jgi:segregation and condensation protein B
MSDSLNRILEALVFAADHPLSASEIKEWLSQYTLQQISNGLNELKLEYERMGRSFSLKEVAKGYQFRTRPEFSAYVLQMCRTSPSRLSRAAMESLAIIAYKQPILRQEIEKIRGVDVGGILKTLLEKGLIRIVGRKNLPGRPLIYGTTNKFLEVFDLTDLNALPTLKEIKKLIVEGDGAGIPEISPQEVEDITQGVNPDHGENEASEA